MSGEKAVFSTLAHVFEIDPETKKRWLPTSSKAVSVSFYHDPSRKTYRIISIESKKALVNSTITANMNFTKTSPKFGQWSDHRANTVYGLGFTSEKDLTQFVEKFNEAKSSARELLREKQNTSQRLTEQDKSPASFGDSFPGSPSVKSPSVISPPASTPGGTLKIPSPREDSESDENRREPKVLPAAIANGGTSPKLPDSKLTNGHNSEHTTDTGQLETLKLENSRLKMALATSATNVKKWESEMSTLKNNNARLTTALEESTQHVSQWKQMLQKYKEENDQLKSKIERLESDREAGAESVKKENDELKEVLSAVQIDLENNQEEVLRKTSENENLREELTEMAAKLQNYEEETQGLVGQVSLLEDQLKMASIASHRKLGEVQKKQGQVGAKLLELVQLHKEISSHLNT